MRKIIGVDLDDVGGICQPTYLWCINEVSGCDLQEKHVFQYNITKCPDDNGRKPKVEHFLPALELLAESGLYREFPMYEDFPYFLEQLLMMGYDPHIVTARILPPEANNYEMLNKKIQMDTLWWKNEKNLPITDDKIIFLAKKDEYLNKNAFAHFDDAHHNLTNLTCGKIMQTINHNENLGKEDNIIYPQEFEKTKDMKKIVRVSGYIQALQIIPIMHRYFI